MASLAAPLSSKGRGQPSSFSSTGYRAHVERSVRKHAGAPHSGTLRIVSRSCNNGWMSIRKTRRSRSSCRWCWETRTLFRKDQTILAAWMSMFAMVAEFRSKTERRIAVSAEQRRYLMDQRRPPAHWKIWIGHFQREQLEGVYFTMCCRSTRGWARRPPPPTDTRFRTRRRRQWSQANSSRT